MKRSGEVRRLGRACHIRPPGRASPIRDFPPKAGQRTKSFTRAVTPVNRHQAPGEPATASPRRAVLDMESSILPRHRIDAFELATAPLLILWVRTQLSKAEYDKIAPATHI